MTGTVPQVSWDDVGKTVSWYTTESSSTYGPSYQLNHRSGTYHYAAIGGYLVYANMLTTAYQKGFGLSNYYSSNNYGKKSSDGKTFTWYYDYTGSRPNDGINYQCNVSGTVYYYAILG